MREMVVGFYFNAFEEVLLIRKNRPEWQKGKLNGIGGHIEKGETPLEAMEREFGEETGIKADSPWDHFVTMTGSDWRVYFYRAFSLDSFPDIDSPTDEEIITISMKDNLPENIISNLGWLLPLACDMDLESPIQIKDNVWNDTQGES